MPKLIGLGFILLGILMIVFFPYTSAHQPPWFSTLGVLIGLVVLAVGLFLWKL